MAVAASTAWQIHACASLNGMSTAIAQPWLLVPGTAALCGWPLAVHSAFRARWRSMLRALESGPPA